jgi:hypothetical protein
VISQSTDDLTRSELRAIRGHYSWPLQLYDKSRRTPLVCLATGPPSRGQPGLPAVAAASRPGREGVLRRRVGHLQCDSAKQPD